MEKLNWAKEIDKQGRPVRTGVQPSAEGTRLCPGFSGATNWYSPSWNPATGLFYMQTNEKCSIYSLSSAQWEAGKAFLGGAERTDYGTKAQRILRALDLQTGEVKWELPQQG